MRLFNFWRRQANISRQIERSYRLGEEIQGFVGNPIIKISSPERKVDLIYTGPVSFHVIGLHCDDYTEGKLYQIDVTYDLFQGRNIQFKSIQMGILDADNSRIRMVVNDDGDLPWFLTPE